MKLWIAVGALVAVAVAAGVLSMIYVEMADSKSITNDALDYRTSSSYDYEVLHVDNYEFELPTDWQVQPSDVLLDLESDEIIKEATEHRIYDNKFYEYVKSEPSEYDAFQTKIMIHTAKSDLAQDQYEDALLGIMAATEVRYNIDILLLENRLDELGGMPAITMEYTIAGISDSQMQTIKVVETIATTGTALYSISYASEIDYYYEYLDHFDHAVKTFKLR